MKSMGANAFYNVIRNISSFIFPLITFPYVSKVLGVNNMGIYNFSYNYINYFLLIAALGVSGYAIREGARIRHERENVSIFLSEMFSINVICTGIAVVLMVGSVFMFNKLTEYRSIILMLGFIVVFSPFSLTWLYTIFEDFSYITIRTIIFQLISIALIYLTVRDESDIIMYAFITCFSFVGSNIFNFIHSKRFCDIRFTLHIDWKRHLKPILVIFVTSLAITIYVSSDMTILGLICGNYSVGIYGVSVKLYTLLKNGIVSVLTVAQARLAFYIGTNDLSKFQKLSNVVINIVVLLLFPLLTGVIALRHEVICIFSSPEYLEANTSMVMLMIAVAFNIFSQFFNTCILMPYRKEVSIFYLSLAAAGINIILNLILIPHFEENAAAFTTIVAETITFIVELILIKKYLKLEKVFWSNIISTSVGCIIIYAISEIVHDFFFDKYLVIIITVTCSVLCYTIVQFITNNRFVISFCNTMLMPMLSHLHR